MVYIYHINRYIYRHMSLSIGTPYPTVGSLPPSNNDIDILLQRHIKTFFFSHAFPPT